MNPQQQHTFHVYTLIFTIATLIVYSCNSDPKTLAEPSPIPKNTLLDSLQARLDSLAIPKDSMMNLEKANLFHEIGKAYYFSSNYENALQNADSAVWYRNQYLGNHVLTYRSVILCAAILKEQGKHYTAIDSIYDVIDDIRIAHNNGSLTSNEADSLIKKYNSQLADNYLGLNIPHAALNYIDDDLDYRIGVAYEQMGEPDEAIEFCLEHIDFLKTNKANLSPTRYYNHLLTSYNTLALAYQAKGEFSTAIQYFDESIFAIKEIGLESEAYHTEVLINKGLVEGLQEQFTKSEKTLSVAEEQLSEITDNNKHPLYSELYLNKGKVALWQGATKQALDLFQAAALVVVPDFKYKTSEDLPQVEQNIILSKDILINILEAKAKAWQASYKNTLQLEDLEQAFSTFQTLDTLINRLRTDYQMDVSKFWLLKKTRTIYEQAIATCLALHKHTYNDAYVEKAFQYNAHNKAIIMRENQRDEYAKDVARIPNTIQAQEQELAAAIYNLEIQYDQAAKKDNRNVIQQYATVLKQKRTEQRLLIEKIQEIYPKYYKLKYEPLNKIQISKIQSQVEQGEALIEYFLGKDTLYTFVVTQEKVNYYSTLRPTDLTPTIEQLQKEVDRDRNIKYYNRLAYKLYEWILEAPLKPLLTQNINRLTIIPDDVLMRIPYDALRMQAEGETEVSNYVIDKCAVRYLYASQFLAAARNESSLGEPNFLGFGISYQDKQDLSWLNTKISQFIGKNKVTPLPHAVGEVQKITKLLSSSTALIDEKATKKAFIDNCSNFSILHLATHGYLNTSYPLNSALLFAVPDTSGQNMDDVLLTMADIYQFDISADMVVLSACNTAAGELQTGEGIQTLARAFQYAGAKSLVASLWSASDRVSEDIMLSFYENLQAAMPKDEALRQAKLKYRDRPNISPQQQHPASWATFILIGDRTSIIP